MKIYYILFIFCFLSAIAHGQPETSYYTTGGGTGVAGSTSVPAWYTNLEKYWYYRYKLVNDFMIIGTNAGESLPVGHRDLGDNHYPGGAQKNVLNYGSDNTIDLGHYLAVLATEYAQLSNNGLNTDRTVYELRYGLSALHRLCSTSGAYESLTTGGGLVSYPGYSISTTSLIPYLTSEAFFTRDDAPYLTITDHEYNYKYWKHFNRPALLGSDTSIHSIRAVDSASGAFAGHYWGPDPRPGYPFHPNPGGGYGPSFTTWNVANCESQDQLADVFMGVALIAKYLSGDPYGLQTSAKNTAYRLVEWPSRLTPIPLRSYESIPDVNWNSLCAKNKCSSTGAVGFSAPPMTKAANLVCGSAYSSNTILLMSLANNYSEGLGVPPLFIFPYWNLFEMSQYMNPHCSSYLSNQVYFPDNYVCIANDWNAASLYLPCEFWPPCALYDAGLYALFASANLPGTSWGGILPTSWRAIKNHAGSDYNGTSHFPLIYQLYNGDHSWYWNGSFEILLNEAPPCGPYNYECRTSTEDFFGTGGTATFYHWEWSGNDRLADPYHRQGEACYHTSDNDMHYDAEFNGLDYMELFNLYSLERGGACSGCSYLGGMMNSYYCVNYNIDYPDGIDYGSFTNKLKLNWLEYISAIDKIHSGTTPSTDGWVDFRAAKVIDLKPGFHAFQGSFFLGHIKDYTCNGGNDLGHPYEFAQLNPTPAEERVLHKPGDSSSVDTGFRHILYLPNGLGYTAEKLPDADPMDLYTDSLLDARPDIEELNKTYLKYQIINSNISEDYLNAAKEMFGWNDDTIAKYKIPPNLLHPDSITIDLFPNPANDIAYLSYSLSHSNEVNIKLTNTLGQDFSYLIEQYATDQQPGQYKIAINVNNLAPGMYYVSIKIGAVIYSKKLTVIN